MLAENARQSAAADALVVGRRTFTDLRGYWRDLEDDRIGITVLPGDPVEQVRALKARDGADIVRTGSITLTHALLEAGLVGGVRLFSLPWVQGRGRRCSPTGRPCSG